MGKKWDFKGWATRYDVKCSDNRTIRKNAFLDDNQKTVPLVYNHNHNDAENVLGHALLEHRPEGVYAYGKFNNTAQGQNAKELVRNGDLTSLSIFANKLTQQQGNVLHGKIRELSLVLAGANPGARIEEVIAHGGDAEGNGATIWNNSDIELIHSDEEPNNDPDEKTDPAKPDDVLEHKDENEGDKDPDPEKKSKEDPQNMEKDQTVQDVLDTMTEVQRKVVDALVGAALETKNEGEEEMKHNAFQGQDPQNEIKHSELTAIITKATNGGAPEGSLRKAFLQHGIEDVEVLFPEVQALNRTPEIISRPMEWVAKVMAGVSKSPFSRVKSTAVNITKDEARAKGYVKGKQKVEEVIAALKRTTTPTTVYKLQKMDRDDVIDITDFDVIVFIKAEMRVMLDEELARAFLIGDGRDASSDDKVNPLNIRPIYGDNEVYTVNRILATAANAAPGVKAKGFIQDIIRSRKLYKGSGNPTLFTTEDELVEMLLLEDKNERVIYETVEKLCVALRVKEIVTVPVMEGINRVVGTDQFDLAGILVNLTDYSVGADKGGQVAMFDDFDLNFNKYEYLIETRCSGALKKPYSAITFERKGTVVEG